MGFTIDEWRVIKICETQARKGGLSEILRCARHDSIPTATAGAQAFRLPAREADFVDNTPTLRARATRAARMAAGIGIGESRLTAGNALCLTPNSRPQSPTPWEVAMQFEKGTLEILPAALRVLEEGFASLPDIDVLAPGQNRMSGVMQQVAVRLRDNYPYFHPLYAGQMLKPPHPIARAAYALATWINPNNHALDGGRASSAMEKEAVAEIAAMLTWQTYLGHLTSGGTMANLEALWVAGQLHPGKKIAASGHAHYTHHRISSVLGLPFAELPCDPRGRMANSFRF